MGDDIEDDMDYRVKPLFEHIHCHIGVDKGSDDGDYSSESYYGDRDGRFYHYQQKNKV